MSLLRKKAGLLVAGSLAMLMPLPAVATAPDHLAGDAILKSLSRIDAGGDLTSAGLALGSTPALQAALTDGQFRSPLASLSDVVLRDTGILSRMTLAGEPGSALVSALADTFAADSGSLSQMTTTGEPGSALVSALADTFAADSGSLSRMTTTGEPGNPLLSALADHYVPGDAAFSGTNPKGTGPLIPRNR